MLTRAKNEQENKIRARSLLNEHFKKIKKKKKELTNFGQLWMSSNRFNFECESIKSESVLFSCLIKRFFRPNGEQIFKAKRQEIKSKSKWICVNWVCGSQSLAYRVIQSIYNSRQCRERKCDLGCRSIGWDRGLMRCCRDDLNVIARSWLSENRARPKWRENVQLNEPKFQVNQTRRKIQVFQHEERRKLGGGRKRERKIWIYEEDIPAKERAGGKRKRRRTRGNSHADFRRRDVTHLDRRETRKTTKENRRKWTQEINRKSEMPKANASNENKGKKRQAQVERRRRKKKRKRKRKKRRRTIVTTSKEQSYKFAGEDSSKESEQNKSKTRWYHMICGQLSESTDRNYDNPINWPCLQIIRANSVRRWVTGTT